MRRGDLGGDPRPGRRGRHRLPRHLRRLPARRRLTTRGAPRRSSAAGCAASGTGSSSPPSASAGPARRRSTRGNSRKHILDAVEASLRRLQTDYIDLYQLHGYDPATPIDETLGALDDLVRQGKVRYIGCSNFLTYQLVRAVGRSETLGLARFDSRSAPLQPALPPDRARDAPVLRRGGRRGHPLQPDRRRAAVGQAHPRRAARRRDPLHPRQCRADVPGPLLARPGVRHRRGAAPLADEAGVCLVTLAVAWVLANPAITAPIIGASRPEQLDASLAAAEFTLDDELKSRARRGAGV